MASAVVWVAAVAALWFPAPALGQEERSPLEDPPVKYVVRIQVSGSAELDKLVNKGLDIAGNFKRVPDGIEVDVVATEEEVEALEAQGVLIIPAASDDSMRSRLDDVPPMLRRHAELPPPTDAPRSLVRGPLTGDAQWDFIPAQLAPDVVKVGRVDWFTTKGQGFLSVEAKTSLGSTSSVTLDVSWDKGPGTAYNSGGTARMSRFVDANVYMYHRLLFPVGAAGANGPRPQKVTVKSSRSSEDWAYVSDWTYPVTPMTAAKGYKSDFITGYMNATQIYSRMDALAAEYPHLAEIIMLPNKSNGYRRKAQAILGSTSGTAAQGRAVVITSQAWGHEGGNSLRAQIVAPTGTPNQQLTVEVVDNTLVKVTSATNASGAATSTATQVITAINASPAASALVRAFSYRGNAGNGVVQSFGPTTLSDFLAAPASISREPWPMRMIRIGTRRDGSRVGVFIIANDHAREWVTPLVALEAMERLLRNSATDAATKTILDSTDIFIIPSNNPDGNHRTFFDDTGQRRNLTNYCANNNSDPGRRNDWGVDLNRNYTVASGFDGYDGASSSCIDDTYQGPSELSEPETRNIISVVQKYKHIKFFMTIHSNGGQLFWQPGAYRLPNRDGQFRPPFRDESYYWQMGERILAHVKAYQDTPVQPYNVGASSDVLYSSAGNVREELYVNYGIYALGWEIGGSTWNPTTNRWEDGAFQPAWSRAHGETMEYANGVMEMFRIAIDWAKDRSLPYTGIKLVSGTVEGTDQVATEDDPITLPPAGETFSGPVKIRFETSEPANIYYTKDGSRPTLTSAKYRESGLREEVGESILVSETTTFNWFAVDPAGNIENRYVPDSKAQTFRTATITIAPGGSTGSTLPAKVWVGLKNGDDAGLRVDLLAEVLVDGSVVSSRQVSEIAAGGTGFANAVLRTVPLAMSAVTLPAPGTLEVRLSARRSCYPGTGPLAGSVRLWFNGPAVDSGATRNAGSRVLASVSGVPTPYYLRSGFDLDPVAGTAATYKDVYVASSQACPNRPFTPFGTWTLD